MKIFDGRSMNNDASRRIADVGMKSLETSTNALLKADTDAICLEFSENFTVAGGDWKFKSREDMCERLASGSVKFEYIKSDVERIDVPNEGAVVISGTRYVKGVVDGNDFASSFGFRAVHTIEGDRMVVGLWAVDCIGA